MHDGAIYCSCAEGKVNEKEMIKGLSPATLAMMARYLILFVLPR